MFVHMAEESLFCAVIVAFAITLTLWLVTSLERNLERLLCVIK